MTKEEITRMALEASATGCGDELTGDAIERFAYLVAAAEREACAKVCDLVGYDHEVQQGAELAFDLAAAIRARGETK